MSVSSIPGSQAESQDWIELPLLELIEPLESGSRPKGGVRGIDSGIPSVGGEHLTAGGGFNFAKVKFVPKSFYASMRRGHIRRGDILIVKDGATTGKVALVRDDFPFKEAVVNEHLFIIRPKADHDSRYIFWYLHSKEGQERVLEHFQGAAQGGINQQFAPGTLVPIPPTRDDEATIAAQIEGLVEGLQCPRDRLTTIPALLKKFRQSVLAAACSGHLTADWREFQPNALSADELLVELIRMREHVIGTKSKQPVAPDPEAEYDMPTVWVHASIDALSTKVADGVHKTPKYQPSGIPFVTVRNLTAGPEISFEKLNYISEADHAEFTARTKPERGDILISKDGTIGTVRVINTDREFSIFVSVALVKVADKRITPYLELALNCPAVQGRMSRTGTGLQHLVLRDLRQLAIPLPPLDEQAEIVRRVEALFALADSIESRLAEATTQVERTTQAILAKAFRGELTGDIDVL